MNKIIEDFVKKITSEQDIEVIILFGSYARGNERPDSDVDLIIAREGELIRTTEEFDGKTFEITFNTIDGIKRFWDNNKNDCAELWSYGKVVYSKDGKGEELEKYGESIRDKGPEKLSDTQIKHSKFDFEDQLKSIEFLSKKDPLAAELIASKKILDSIHMFFVLRGEWVPAIKQQAEEIKKKDKEFSSLIEAFYSSKDLGERLDILHKVKEKLY